MAGSGEGNSQLPAGSDSARCAVRLAETLLESVTALARAGEVETACRLAGRACVALRAAEPALARRFDVLLHRLTRSLTW